MSTQASSGICRDRRRHRLHAGAHGHRVTHVQPPQGGDRVVGPEPRVHPHRQLAAGTGAAHPGDELVDEPAGTALGVGGSFAHPGVQHLTAVGPGGEQRVIAEHVGVAEPGTLFLFAVDRTDRRVDVDHQRIGAGTGTGRPRPLQGLADDGFELADMPEREGTQERPQRRRRHHPMTEHPGGRAGTQQVGVIDVAKRRRSSRGPTSTPCVPAGHHRPGRSSFTVASINVSNPSRSDNVATSSSPASATRFGSSKMTSIRSMLCDTRVTGSASCPGQQDDVEHRHCPSSGGLSGGYAGRLNPPHRWIEAKAGDLGRRRWAVPRRPRSLRFV